MTARSPVADGRVATQLTPPIAGHGEGPWWDHRVERFVWLDMMAGVVYATSVDGETDAWAIGRSVVSLVRARCGTGYVVADATDVYTTSGFGAALNHLASVEIRPRTRLNEGCCAPDGSLWIGSMHEDFECGAGSLYRVDGRGGVTTLIDLVTVSNGLAFLPEGHQAVYVDSLADSIDLLELAVASDALARRPWTPVDRACGQIDGICCDLSGGVWAAVWGGGEVRHYGPRGNLVDRVALPVSYPTACALGGGDGDVLFVTTSRVPGEVASGAAFTVTDLPCGAAPLWPFEG